MTKAERTLLWRALLDLIIEDEFVLRCAKIARHDPEMKELLLRYLTKRMESK